ncbi:MAG: sugar phosphate isomerase/epimerase [Candidatus Omnitrophica bacterium]|nr:sugar phosphate isomerase/epimerase [Candidatus Omnitrophota bacterium]
MGLALSTSWNAFRHSNAKNLLFEITGLGFEELELSFNLSPKIIEGIEDAVRKNTVRITSLHNFCPIPEGIKQVAALPDCYSMASPDPEERELSVRYTKISIDTARRLGAKALVLHCGRIEIPDRTRELIHLYQARSSKSPAFKELKSKAIEERASHSREFLENTLRSLEELSRYAAKEGISLGIETRFYHREIPSFDEIGVILKKFKGSPIHYWHDTGHAQVMQNLGFFRHEDFLDAYGQDIIGIHLHDVNNCLDHHAPGKGELDFSRFRRYLKKETLKVIEAHHPATPQDIKESKKLLEGIFNDIL